MLLTHALLPLLQRAPEAAVVNVGSAFGALGHPGFTAYCASKFGLRGFTEALARELADGKIRVLYLAPRVTATAMNDSRVEALNTALGHVVDPPRPWPRACCGCCAAAAAGSAWAARRRCLPGSTPWCPARSTPALRASYR